VYCALPLVAAASILNIDVFRWVKDQQHLDLQLKSHEVDDLLVQVHEVGHA
jgi:hypothetical protein